MDLRHSKATLISLGAVDTTGVPALNQVARFFDADTVQGSANFTFTGSLLTLTGTQTIIADSASALRVRTTGGEFTTHFEVDTTGTAIIKLSSGSELRWGSDLKLFRDGAWQLALRDGTNANFFYVYGTITDSNNYERLALYAGASANHFLEPQSAGTGEDNINLTVRPLGTGDFVLGRAGVNAGTTFMFVKARRVEINHNQNGQQTLIATATATVLTPSGSSAAAFGLIPAGSLVIAITTRVITTVTGPAGYDVGDGTTVDLWGNSIAVAAGSTSDLTDQIGQAVAVYPFGNDVRITSDGVDFTGGEIRITVHYLTVVAPTS